MSYVVPPIVMFLSKHPMVAKADLSSLNRVISGAAPLGPEMVEEFQNKNPNCAIGQGSPAFFLCSALMTVSEAQLCFTVMQNYLCCMTVTAVLRQLRRNTNIYTQ